MLLMDVERPIFIGIAGGTASGKTSIAKRLEENFSDRKSFVIIKEDDYYNDQSDMEFEERLKVNYDHPLAFDHQLLLEHLELLSQRQDIQKPTYDYVKHTRAEASEIVKAADVIILEGLFVLDNAAIRDRLDIKVFVDTPADVRFIRRLKRDIQDRGRTMDGVIEQYLSTVRIMHEEFIEPSKKYADLIIPEGGQNEVAIDLLEVKIGSIIKRKALK